MSDSDPLIRELAARAGVAVSWRDMAGQDNPVSIETLRALLGALGYPADHDADVRNSLAIVDAGVRIDSAQSHFVTARVGQPVALPVGVENGTAIEVVLEGGERMSANAVESRTGALTLPPMNAPGYHEAFVKDAHFTIATAPPRCPDFLNINHGRPGWGVAAQIYSLGSGVECGIGDFGGVADLATAAGGRGADLLAISPSHATLGVPSRYDSPYAASSRQFFNPIYADPTLVLPPVLTGPPAASSPEDGLIDWPRALQAKLKALKAAYQALRAQEGPERDAFETFRSNASQALRRHALFEAMRACQPSWDWREWPADLRTPDGGGVEAFARGNGDAVSFQMFLQWLTGRSCAFAQAAAKQAGMSVGLIADIATGVDPAGSDAWARPRALMKGVTMGAPPDFFTPDGQDWRLTTFSPTGLAATRYAPFIDMIRACLEHVGGLRLDHVMGLQRLWLIPEGMEKSQGAYVRFPAEILFRLIALEAWSRNAIVIGEDLGTLPVGFQDYVAQQGVIGMRLLRIERDDRGWKPPHLWSSGAAALTATHDIIATAGWWKGADLGDADKPGRERRGSDRTLLWSAFRDAAAAFGPPPPPERASEAVDAAFAYVAKTPCAIKLVAYEDVLSSDIQPNVPGTSAERPNWRHRFPETSSRALARAAVRRRLRKLGSPRRND